MNDPILGRWQSRRAQSIMSVRSAASEQNWLVTEDELRVWQRTSTPEDAASSKSVPSYVLPAGTKIKVLRRFKLSHGGSPNMAEVVYFPPEGAAGAGLPTRAHGVVRWDDMSMVAAFKPVDHEKFISVDSEGREFPCCSLHEGELDLKKLVGPADVPEMAPADRQKRIDALLDRWNKEPEKREEIERRLRDLRALSALWMMRRAGIPWTQQRLRCSGCNNLFHEKDMTFNRGARIGDWFWMCKNCSSAAAPENLVGLARRAEGADPAAGPFKAPWPDQIQAFMQAVYDQTQAHPFTRGQRVWNDEVILEVSPWAGGPDREYPWIVNLKWLQSMTPGKGHARACLKWLTALADEYGVFLELEAKPTGTPKIPKKKLINLYKDEGFESKDQPQDMQRQPLSAAWKARRADGGKCQCRGLYCMHMSAEENDGCPNKASGGNFCDSCARIIKFKEGYETQRIEHERCSNCLNYFPATQMAGGTCRSCRPAITENAECAGCGRSDLPLHTDGRCPACSKNAPIDDAPETPADVPGMKPAERQKKIDALLDRWSKEPEKRPQIEQQLKSLRALSALWMMRRAEKNPDGSVNWDTVEAVAEQARAIMIETNPEADFRPLSMCGVANESLAQELLKLGLNVEQVVGVFLMEMPGYPGGYDEVWPESFEAEHSWLEVDGKIVDIAADQFNEYLHGGAYPPVFIGTNDGRFVESKRWPAPRWKLDDLGSEKNHGPEKQSLLSTWRRRASRTPDFSKFRPDIASGWMNLLREHGVKETVPQAVVDAAVETSIENLMHSYASHGDGEDAQSFIAQWFDEDELCTFVALWMEHANIPVPESLIAAAKTSSNWGSQVTEEEVADFNAKPGQRSAGGGLDNFRRECDHAEKPGGWCGRCEGRAPKKRGRQRQSLLRTWLQRHAELPELPAEDHFSPEVLDKIMDSNKRLWADTVEAMALKAMPYLQESPRAIWDEKLAAEAVARAYGTGDVKAVYETPIMKAVLDQVLSWMRNTSEQRQSIMSTWTSRRASRNPDRDQDLFNFQDSQIEPLPKLLQNIEESNQLGIRLENAGDIFRELVWRDDPDPGYIGEKVGKIQRHLTNPHMTQEMPHEAMALLSQIIDLFNSIDLSGKSPLLIAARDLNLALAHQDMGRAATLLPVFDAVGQERMARRSAKSIKPTVQAIAEQLRGQGFAEPGTDPQGECERVSAHLAEALANQGIETWIVEGTVGREGHVWVEAFDLDGTILGVDITADQFGKGYPEIMVVDVNDPAWSNHHEESRRQIDKTAKQIRGRERQSLFAAWVDRQAARDMKVSQIGTLSYKGEDFYVEVPTADLTEWLKLRNDDRIIHDKALGEHFMKLEQKIVDEAATKIDPGWPAWSAKQVGVHDDILWTDIQRILEYYGHEVAESSGNLSAPGGDDKLKQAVFSMFDQSGLKSMNPKQSADLMMNMAVVLRDEFGMSIEDAKAKLSSLLIEYGGGGPEDTKDDLGGNVGEVHYNSVRERWLQRRASEQIDNDWECDDCDHLRHDHEDPTQPMWAVGKCLASGCPCAKFGNEEAENAPRPDHGPGCFCQSCVDKDDMSTHRCPSCGSTECHGDGDSIECRRPGTMTLKDVPVETRDSLLDKFNRGEIDEVTLRRRMKQISSVLGQWRLRRASGLVPDNRSDLQRMADDIFDYVGENPKADHNEIIKHIAAKWGGHPVDFEGAVWNAVNYLIEDERRLKWDRQRDQWVQKAEPLIKMPPAPGSTPVSKVMRDISVVDPAAERDRLLDEFSQGKIDKNVLDQKLKRLAAKDELWAPDPEIVKNTWRRYKCSVCGEVQGVSTNHLGAIMDYCKKCSWAPSKGECYDPLGNGRCYRKFTYVGEIDESHTDENGFWNFSALSSWMQRRAAGKLDRYWREWAGTSQPSVQDAAKKAFHKEALRVLKNLADALGLAEGEYDLRSNKGGIAVMGEVTLHSDDIYVQIGARSQGLEVMYRTVNGRGDYSGGKNNWMSYADVENPAQAAAKISALMGKELPNRPEPSGAKGALTFETERGSRYEVLENGNIVRLDMKDFQPSGQWRLVGIQSPNGAFIPFEAFRSSGLPKSVEGWSIIDFDHGTTRQWGEKLRAISIKGNPPWENKPKKSPAAPKKPEPVEQSKPDMITAIEDEIINLLRRGPSPISRDMNELPGIDPRLQDEVSQVIGRMLDRGDIRFDGDTAEFSLLKEPEPTEPEHLPEMSESDRQMKIDTLLDQMNSEPDPAKKKQIEQRLRSLRASRFVNQERRGGIA